MSNAHETTFILPRNTCIFMTFPFFLLKIVVDHEQLDVSSGILMQISTQMLLNVFEFTSWI